MNMLQNPRFPIRLFGVFVVLLTLVVPHFASADHGGSGHVDMGLAIQSMSTNSYNVTWNDIGWGSYTYYLQESIGNGAYTTLSANRATSASFTNQANGNYKYRIIYQSCFFGSCNSQWTEPVTISIGPLGTVDSLTDQYNYVYEARYNGGQDIFLKRTSETDPGDGAIDMLLLYPSNSGTFMASVPTAAQITQASSWPIAALELRLGDVNVDGFVDIALVGLGNVVSGATDQIVFAPGQTQVELPMGVRKLDQHLIEFATDLTNYSRDPNYFNNAAVEVEGGYWSRELECNWIWHGETWEFVCDWHYVWVEIDPFEIFPGINGSAIKAWKKIKAMLSGQGTMQDVADVVSDVFGVAIGGAKFCIDIGVDDDTCLEFEISFAIAALANDAEVEGTASTREAGVVYLTRRRTWFGPLHTALEFTFPGSKFKEVYSAAASCPLALCLDDKLKSEFRRPKDLLNDTAGIVTSENPLELPSIYWLKVIEADGIYNDCLPYEGTPGFDGYNSNGYTAGMLIVTGGVSPEPMTNYIGGGRPVPSGYLNTPNIPCP